MTGWRDTKDDQQREQLTFLAAQAHPDDETMLMAGTLAHYFAKGIRTVLVTCTGGELGEVIDPDPDPVATQGQLGSIRR
ncbi:MAG TPA: PIG-L family deacetylase, partial [Dehalococcoidia bacterium]|nr:PIG-L family deacetylase [Dehalococcoidia bacterium]